jgi:RNA polymerase sigma-B factor
MSTPHQRRPSPPLPSQLPSPPLTRSIASALPRRERHIHAHTNALVLENLDLAERVAASFARRTQHPREDLYQIAVIGLIKASRGFDPARGSSFRAYARPFVNGEITHWLRANGFLLTLPTTWREFYSRGQKLVREGTPPGEIPARLSITPRRWQKIVQACSVRIVSLPESL